MELAGRPDRQILGKAGEYTARLLVEEAGLRVVDVNWRDGRRGELDIVARDDTDARCSWTVVVEVRTRVGRRKGSALASVDGRKVARLRALTGAWCRGHGRLCSRVRLDVVAITVDARSLTGWPSGLDEAVDLRSLGAEVLWLRGVQ